MQSKPLILLVDDVPENLDVLVGILGDDYALRVANCGEIALKVAQAVPQPDLILLDLMMPGLDGFEVLQQLKSKPKTQNIPVIVITASSNIQDETRGLNLGAVDYMTKPVRPSIVLARVKNQLLMIRQREELERQQLMLKDQKRILEVEVAARTAEISQTRLEIIRSLGQAAEYRDDETGFHILRMSRYARLIALEYGVDAHWADLLQLAAPMHDVGKIGIPDYVLLKKGSLAPEEWDIMRQHPKIGAEIIGEHAEPLLAMAREVAFGHHEKWNGKGYPMGLQGTEIPLSARIVAIADVFDALTSERPYKTAWTVERACDLVRNESGQHFEPDLVDAFFRALPAILEIKESYQESKLV